MRALAVVVAEHPDVLYVVAGRTHPEVVRREGERYRDSSAGSTSELGLDEHVLFVDRYLSDDDIRASSAHRVFLTPYRAQEQVVSGVLTFALAAGCPVVSTPYFYATELLSTGAGRLVGFDDHEAMARRVVTCSGTSAAGAAAQRARASAPSTPGPRSAGRRSRCWARGEVHASDGGPASGIRVTAGWAGRQPRSRHATWSARGGRRHRPARRGTGARPSARATASTTSPAWPWWRTRSQPRAGTRVAGGGAGRASTSSRRRGTRTRGDAQLPRVDGGWLDQPHPGDHLGRAMWALGEIGSGSGPLAQRSRGLLGDVVSADPPSQPEGRGVRRARADPAARRPAGGAAGCCTSSPTSWRAVRENASPEWQWFEDELTYDNAGWRRHSSPPRHRAGRGPARRASRRSSGTAHQCGLDSDAVVLVGNRWRHRRCRGTARGREGRWPAGRGGAPGDEGDEQPLDAAALVEACVEAYRVTGSPPTASGAVDAFAWFHGRNRWGLAVYDEVSGGCHDGVGPRRAERQRGSGVHARLPPGVAGPGVRRPEAGGGTGEGRPSSDPIAWRTPPEHYGPWEQVPASSRTASRTAGSTSLSSRRPTR